MRDLKGLQIDARLLHDLRCFLATSATTHPLTDEQAELKRQAADLAHRLEAQLARSRA